MFDPCRNHDGNDRRNFLRFLVGGTAGLGLLPAPLWSADAAGLYDAEHFELANGMEVVVISDHYK